MSPPATHEPMETSEWFYLRNRQKAGPFTLAQLRLLVEAGELQADDLVLRQGTDQWAPVSSVPALAEASWPASTSRPKVAISPSPSPAEPIPRSLPPDEDRVPPRRQPLVTGGGFWRWYRTRPGWVVLIVAGLAALALIPVLLFVLVVRQQRMQAMVAMDRAMMAEMQAREMVEMERQRAEVVLEKAQRALADRVQLPAVQPEQPPEGAFALLKAKLKVEPLKPVDGDDELRKLLKERYNAAQASVKGIVARREGGPGVSLLQLRRAVKKWIAAELELSDKPMDQLAVLETNLALARELEQAANSFLKTGQMARDEVETFRYYRLDAEIQLLKAKRKLKQPDK